MANKKSKKNSLIGERLTFPIRLFFKTSNDLPFPTGGPYQARLKYQQFARLR